MKSLGIIAEFNPLHNGHKYLIEKAKNELKTDLSVSIMSGDFVQRGEAAIIDKYSRAKTALDNGLDLVIEMPNFISLQSAEFFLMKIKVKNFLILSGGGCILLPGECSDYNRKLLF